MTALSWADRIAAATVQFTPRQVGAVAVVYPLLEELRVRETINALRQTGADIDLGPHAQSPDGAATYLSGG